MAVTIVIPRWARHLLVLAGCVVLTLVGGVSAEASTGTTGGLNWTVADGKATITGCDGSDSCRTSVVIPASVVDGVNSYPVTAIGDSAFAGSAGALSPLTTITFASPSNLTSIGNEAFAFTQLTSLTIPASVTTLGNALFSNSAVRTVTFASPGNLTTLGRFVFQDVTTLQTVTLPDGLTTIAEGALAGQSGLTSIAIPTSVTTIGTNAFGGSGLTSITIPANVETIGASAFAASQLATITFASPSNLTSIGDYAFANTDLAEIAFPACTDPCSTPLSLGNALFDSSTVRTVTFASPGNLRTLGQYVFQDVTTLQTVTLPDGLTTIGDGSLAGQSGLTSITIPTSVTTIGDNAFGGSGLTSITIPTSVTTIGDSAFAGSAGALSPLTTITFASPSNLTSIGDYAFANTDLAEIAFPACTDPCSTPLSLGNALFDSSTVRTVTFASPGNLRTLGQYVFQDVTTLQTVTLPDGLQAIAEDAFHHGGVTPSAITVPASVTTIGTNAFNLLAATARIDFEGAAPSDANHWRASFNETSRIRFQPGAPGWSTPPNQFKRFLTEYYLAAPRAPSATAGVRSASITVAARPSPNPTWQRITVTASPGGRTCVIAGPSGTCTIDGLQEGVAYTFTARAAIDDPALTSDPSPGSAPVTPQAPAPEPTPDPEPQPAPQPEPTPQEQPKAKNPPKLAPRTSVRGNAIATSIALSGPGAVVQTGTIITGTRSVRAACRTRRAIPRAGTYRISCVLNAKAKALRRKQALRLRITTTFTPKGGKAQTVRTTVRLPRTPR